MKRIKARVTYKVWEEIEVSDEVGQQIIDGDKDVIEATEQILLDNADSTLLNSSVKPTLEYGVYDKNVQISDDLER